MRLLLFIVALAGCADPEAQRQYNQVAHDILQAKQGQITLTLGYECENAAEKAVEFRKKRLRQKQVDHDLSGCREIVPPALIRYTVKHGGPVTCGQTLRVLVTLDAEAKRMHAPLFDDIKRVCCDPPTKEDLAGLVESGCQKL